MKTLNMSKVYDLLTSIAGADRRDYDREYFIQAHAADPPCDEFRFQGCLGFGGKYWRETNRVSCYPEDETPERLAIIKQLNSKLADLANEP